MLIDLCGGQVLPDKFEEHTCIRQKIQRVNWNHDLLHVERHVSSFGYLEYSMCIHTGLEDRKAFVTELISQKLFHSEP